MTDDQALVDAELARLDPVQPGNPYGFERAIVRRTCLRRLSVEHAAAVLRQETLFALNPGDSPWYGPGHPRHTWSNECNRMHFLAGVAGLVGYDLPDPHEMINMVRTRYLYAASRRGLEWPW